jgi:hypothetical protein
MPDSKPEQPSMGEPQAAPATSALSPFRSRIFLALWIASLLSNFGSLIQTVGATWLMTSLAPQPTWSPSSKCPQSCRSCCSPSSRSGSGCVGPARDHVAGAGLHAGGLDGTRGAGLVRPDHALALVLLTFLLGMGAALYGPAWQSSVREQVPRPELPAAVALNSVAFNLARAAGPALGGAIVAWAGATVAFGINAVSYIGLIAVLLTWKRPATEARLPPETMMAALLAACGSHACPILCRRCSYALRPSGSLRLPCGR